MSAIPDDLGKIHFRADFILQTQFFLRELLFQFPNLSVDQRIFDRESNLVCNLAKEGDIGLTESIVPESAKNQDANRAIPAIHRKKQKGFKPSQTAVLTTGQLSQPAKRHWDGKSYH